MLGLKLIHVSKRGPSFVDTSNERKSVLFQILINSWKFDNKYNASDLNRINCMQMVGNLLAKRKAKHAVKIYLAPQM